MRLCFQAELKITRDLQVFLSAISKLATDLMEATKTKNISFGNRKVFTVCSVIFYRFVNLRTFFKVTKLIYFLQNYGNEVKYFIPMLGFRPISTTSRTEVSFLSSSSFIFIEPCLFLSFFFKSGFSSIAYKITTNLDDIESNLD